MLVRALIILLTLAFVPAFGEVIESVVHVAEFGDAIHGSSDHAGGRGHHDSTPLGADEHGCSPMLHLCGCHAPALVNTSAAAARAPRGPTAGATVEPTAPLALAGLGLLAPPTRPPIA